MPAGLYCQGTGGKALAMAVEAARHGAEPIAVAAYPVASLLNRVSAEVLCEALTGLELEHGVDVDRVWDASRFIDAHVTSRMPALPVPPRIILRTAISRLPVGLVADIDARLRAADALDRLDEVLAELNHVRADCGTAPLAQPIGGILAGQAVTPRADRAPLGRGVRRDARRSSPARTARRRSRSRREAARARRRRCRSCPSPTWTTCARRPAGPAARRTCCCWRSSARTRPACSTGCAGAAAARRSADAVDHSQSERVRELIRLLEASDDVASSRSRTGRCGSRCASRRSATSRRRAGGAAAELGARAAEPEVSSAIRLESPMVGTFYRSPSPAQPAFVDEGDRVEVGQTLCILEAMKLFNEYKSDHAGVIRRILVENAQPVEYGQPLFELEPV